MHRDGCERIVSQDVANLIGGHRWTGLIGVEKSVSFITSSLRAGEELVVCTHVLQR